MRVRIYLALMAAAILIPVIIFSATALNMLLDAEREAALRGVRETARATALAVDRELTGASIALNILATSPNLAAGNLPEFYRQVLTADMGEGTWTVLFDRSGRQLINTRVPFDTVLPPLPNPERMQQVLQVGKPLVTNLMHGGAAERPVVMIGIPASDNSGEPYVLAQTFVPEYFNRAFVGRDIPPSWILGISDHQGRTIARSHRSLELTGKPINAELLRAARAANEGQTRNLSREGIDVYTLFTRSEISGWLIAVGVPAREIELLARRAVIVTTLGLLAAIACAAGGAAFFGRRLARSIAAAARSAAALGRGEVPSAASSGVTEVDAVHAALAEAGAVLMLERRSRTLAEAERSRLLASEQEARQLAESQNKAKDEFLAMLGHELRNPLGAITSAISLLEIEGVGEERARRAREIIGRQSRHLSRIVDDLLDVDRVMSGKIFLNRQRIDLAEAVRSCLETLTTTRLAGRQTVEVHTQPAWVNADPTRLEQIISNLLVNASKYTPAGGRIDVTVTTASGEAVLVVKDSGVGISEQLMPHIFDIFVQGPAQLDRAQGGLGIGLALVRQLVALHGGVVTAESPGAGQGSTFTVRLPAAEAATDAAADSVNRTVEKSRRVLLIEDNEDSRQTLATILSMHGHSIRQAGDGIAGLNAALADRPDVAVIDIGLPGMDGYAVARRLRSEPDARQICLIALTGYGQAEDRQRALDAGFDIHLTKPVEPKRLLEAVATIGAPAA